MERPDDLSSFTGVVKFTAKWCGPCNEIHPHLVKKTLEATPPVALVLVDIDDDANAALVEQSGVKSIPAMMFMCEGTVVAEVVGGGPSLDYAFEKLEATLAAHREKKEAARQIRLPTCADATVTCQPSLEHPMPTSAPK